MIPLLSGQTWEDFMFKFAQAKGTPEAYAKYIASYPSGRHVEEALRLQAKRKRYPLLTATSPAGTTGRECDQCPEMVVVPAGRFRMGDLSGAGFQQRTTCARRDGFSVCSREI